MNAFRQAHRHRGSRGVALVEAAIVIPLLAMLVIGMFEAGFAYMDGNTLARATQQSARTDSRLANNPSADYEALRALESGLSSLRASSVKRVIIYDASGSGDQPPPACLGLPRPNDFAPVGLPNCNVYSAMQVASDSPGSFGCDAVPWDGPDSSWDSNFCPTGRDRHLSSADRIGVWVELSYDKVTSVLPGSMSLTRASVYQLEPCIAGDSSC